MHVSLLPFDVRAAISAHHQQRVQGRSRGRHLSEIIKFHIRHVDPKRFPDSPIDPFNAELGFVFEDVLAEVLAHHLGWDQVEVEEDGILMTLDGFNARDGRVMEAKATKMSNRDPITSVKFRHWHYQFMAYAHAMGVTAVELYPFFVNGGYELGGGRFGAPTIGEGGRPFLIEFSVRERQQNWDMVRRLRDRMDKEGA